MICMRKLAYHALRVITTKQWQAHPDLTPTRLAISDVQAGRVAAGSDTEETKFASRLMPS